MSLGLETCQSEGSVGLDFVREKQKEKISKAISVSIHPRPINAFPHSKLPRRFTSHVVFIFGSWEHARILKTFDNTTVIICIPYVYLSDYAIAFMQNKKWTRTTSES